MMADSDGQTAIRSTEESGPPYAGDDSRAEVTASESADRVTSNGHGEPPPAAQTGASEPVSDEPVASAGEPVASEQPSPESRPGITPDTERPAVGPKILGVAEPPKPLPTVKASLPTRKRRRRPSAAERHRRAFFSALTELRRGTAPPEPQASEAQPQGAAAEGQPAAPEAEATQQSQADRSPARLTAAIERVGGADVVKEALKPKQDEKGQPLKWAAVCAQAAEGLKPGDPVFNAWVRLAATPVREVKGQLPRPPEPERGGRSGGERRSGQRSGGRGDRGRRDDRQSRQDYASHAQDGTLRKSIRFVTGHDEDQERRERERLRKEQREAKRRAERERLARLGY